MGMNEASAHYTKINFEHLVHALLPILTYVLGVALICMGTGPGVILSQDISSACMHFTVPG